MDILHAIRKVLGCKEDEYLFQIESLKKQIDALTPTNLTFPPSLGRMTYQELYGMLSIHAKSVYVSDTFLNLTSLDAGKVFVAETKVQYQKWVQENHDCDNFSFEMMGYWSEGMWSYAFGIAWTIEHAFNFMIDNNKQLWVVEPQTGNFMKIEDLLSNPMYYPWVLALC